MTQHTAELSEQLAEAKDQSSKYRWAAASTPAAQASMLHFGHLLIIPRQHGVEILCAGADHPAGMQQVHPIVDHVVGVLISATRMRGAR